MPGKSPHGQGRKQGDTADKKGQERGETRKYSLSAEQLRLLEAAAKSPRERAYIRLMARWGLRAGEVAHLSTAWLTDRRGIISIPSMCRCRRCLEKGKPWTAKTAAGNRMLPIFRHTESWESVKIYLERFPTPESSQVSRQAVWRIVKRISNRTGLLDHVFPHALRATAATQLASMGLNEMQLCQAMGWVNLANARPYVRSSGAALDEVLKDKDLKWW